MNKPRFGAGWVPGRRRSSVLPGFVRAKGLQDRCLCSECGMPDAAQPDRLDRSRTLDSARPGSGGSWVSLQQACQALGVSRWTLNRLVRSGELKPGLHVRYWALTPGQKRPRLQYHLGEIEKQIGRISMRHHRLRLQGAAR